MDVAYWDQLATTYSEEVLSSFHADRSGAIRRCLDDLGGPRKTVLDLGCGVGNYLHALSKRFGRVVGVDQSEELLEVARRDHGHRSNVELRCVDAADGRAIRGARANVVVCANVLIMADAERRDAILRAARDSMTRNGRLVLVVPSLESALWAHRRLAEWYEREGAEDPETEAEEDAVGPSKRACRELLRGLVRIDDVPTKHHLAEELVLTLRHRGLQVRRLERVHYPWDSEFGEAPAWMRDPYPWDWLAVASKSR